MYTERQFCLLFFVDVKLGVSHQGKNTLRIFSKKLLKKIFGPEREEVQTLPDLRNVKLTQFQEINFIKAKIK